MSGISRNVREYTYDLRSHHPYNGHCSETIWKTTLVNITWITDCMHRLAGIGESCYMVKCRISTSEVRYRRITPTWIHANSGVMNYQQNTPHHTLPVVSAWPSIGLGRSCLFQSGGLFNQSLKSVKIYRGG